MLASAGITAHLKNGGTLEEAAMIANQASTRTTQLYDRRSDEVSLDEVRQRDGAEAEPSLWFRAPVRRSHQDLQRGRPWHGGEDLPAPLPWNRSASREQYAP